MNPSLQTESAGTPTISGSKVALPSSILLYYAAFYMFAFLTPLASLPDNPTKANLLPLLLTAWIGATAGILLIWVFLSSRKSHPVYLLIIGGIAIDLACNYLAVSLGVGSRTGGLLLRTLYFGFLATGNLGELAAAAGAGILVARGLQKPNYLVMAAIVGAVTDIFSVYAGPSKHMVTSTIFPYVSFQWGIWGMGVQSCVGAGDFIFLTLYLAGSHRFGLDERKTLFAMIAAFGLGSLCLLLIPAGIPALPFMAALLLVVHGRRLKQMMREDREAGQ